MRVQTAAIVLVALCSGAAHSGTIASGNAALGGNSIRALSGNVATSYYGGGPMTYFATFTGAHFSAAQSAPTASTLATPLPGAWNNAANTVGNFSGTFAGALNSAGARWIHDSTNNNNGGHSVLYAIPFVVGNTNSISMTITWLTDNGFGNTNGANGLATPTGFANDGMFVNGGSLGYSAPGGTGQPASFASISQLTFGSVAVNPNSTNWLYLYQFNWGGPGGSAFTIEGDFTPVPNPIAALSGATGLLMLAARRRRA